MAQRQTAMKLRKLHEDIGAMLLGNAAIKGMLHPLNKQYWSKDTNKTDTKPPKPQSGPYQGGHYDALIEGNPRLKKYFGGSFTKSI